MLLARFGGLARLGGCGRLARLAAPCLRFQLARGLSSEAGQLQGSSPHPAWRLVEHTAVQELQLDCWLLEHRQLGTQHLHLGCPDQNNAFSINFRTPPGNSSGVAHILEHTVLCGSSRFPVRDPFMKMLNRSLSSFMNAMTGPDYTLYPFSTCNEADFYNLLSVYLDSVLRPLLREEDFLQEGWRLEHEELSDTSTPLVIKGVVFNEMKGAYANSQSLFGQKLLNNLYPSGTYGHSSGGFPLSIPSLSWEQLKKFHAQHYHPSNARTLSYGSLPLADLLDRLTPHLAGFTRLPAAEVAGTAVAREPRWTEPRWRAVAAPPDPLVQDPARQSSLAVSWLLADIADRQLGLALHLVAELLASGPASPFHRALIQPGLASSFSPVSGYEDHTRETNWTLALQNIDIKDKETILGIIDNTLDIVIKEGFEADRIEAVLHSYELSLKHKSANFGVNLIMSLTPFFNHSQSPLDFLQVNKTLDWIKEQLGSDSKFLQNLVEKHIKNNPHKLVQTMSPVEDYSEAEQAEFDQLERELRGGLTEEDKAEIHSKAVVLAGLQDEKEDTSCLPSLRLADISEVVEGVEMQQLQLQSVPVQLAAQPTNELTYFRALLDTQAVPADLQHLLPVFAAVLTRLGAAELGYAALDTAVELRTGGLGAQCHVQPDPVQPGRHSQALLLSSHCLDRNIPAMFDLWSKLFSSTHWEDTARLAQILKMDATESLNGLAHSGHRYAMTHAASRLSGAGMLAEQTGGITHIRKLAALAQADPATLVPQLKALATLLLNKERMRCSLNTSVTDQALTGMDTFLCSLDGTYFNASSTVEPDFTAATTQTHFVTPFPINFTSLAVPTVSYTHPDHARLRVLAALLSSKFLHPEIREKGGAYGGGASAGDGAFTFYSYRDPRNLETFSVYRRAAEWALGESFDGSDVAEAVLRVFQAVDAPVTPGNKGLRYFLTGISDAQFAEHRASLLAVGVADLQAVADTYLLDPPVHGKTMIGGAQPGLEDLGWTVHHQ